MHPDLRVNLIVTRRGRSPIQTCYHYIVVAPNHELGVEAFRHGYESNAPPFSLPSDVGRSPGSDYRPRGLSIYYRGCYARPRSEDLGRNYSVGERSVSQTIAGQ